MTKLKLIINSPGKLESKVFADLKIKGKVDIVDILFWDMENYKIYPDQIKISKPISTWEIIEKGLSGDFSNVDLSLFSDEIELELKEVETAALEMMERIDPARSHTYQERKNLYMYLVCYWLEKITVLKPDVFYTRFTPHEISDFILFHVCKLSNIRVLLFIQTSLPSLYFCCDDYRYPADYCSVASLPSSENDILKYINLVQSKISKKIISPGYYNEIIDNIKSDLISTKNQSTFSCLLFDIKFVSRLFLFAVRILTASVQGNLNERISLLKNLALYANSSGSQVFFKSISEAYEQYCNFNKPERYVYFLLQYQPENTTSPMGGRYNNMMLAIYMLSNALPAGWMLCVKEHPAQFVQNSNYYGYIGRSNQYYKQLANIPRVQLIPTDVDHDSWLEDARCIATITGTVGWEAVLKKKPTIVFGEAWYQEAPGVRRVKNIKDCVQVFENLHDINNEIDENSIIKYVERIAKKSVHICFDDQEARWNGIVFNFEENKKKFETIFCDVLNLE